MSADVPALATPPQTSDLKRLLVLLLLALAVRGWTVINTTVPSRDCIVFVRDGLQLEDPTVEPTRVDFLRKKSEHPPGYPAAIIAMSWMVRPMMGGTTVESMALERSAREPGGGRPDCLSSLPHRSPPVRPQCRLRGRRDLHGASRLCGGHERWHLRWLIPVDSGVGVVVRSLDC